MAQRFINRFRTPLLVLGSALLGVALMLLYLRLDPPAGRYDDAAIQAIADQQIKAITPSPPLEPEIFALVRPSVVTITRDLPRSSTGTGTGAGVVVDLDGSILTAYHVVAGTDSVTVRFADGSTAQAAVVQRQPERDLAVVQVPQLPPGVEPAILAGGVRPGDKVLAIGAPFGLEDSVSAGVVSALGRSFFVEETGQVLSNMIQFDAAINPGNSGGPLVDLNGRVVGIVSGIINPTGQRVFVGLGFAVPIEASAGIVAPLG
jgi:S1-C subfamily serine protease